MFETEGSLHEVAGTSVWLSASETMIGLKDMSHFICTEVWQK